MLTEKEKKWLQERDLRPAPCDNELPGVLCDCCIEIIGTVCPLKPDYRDAAEFAERVAAKLTLEEHCPLPENADLDDCPYFTEDDGSAFSCRRCRLKRARIAVEEEMDNERNHS